MKTINSLLQEAGTKGDFWRETAEDKIALKDRGKTKEQALYLANYFEGKFDGLVEANRVLK